MNPLKSVAALSVLAVAYATSAFAAPTTYQFDPNHSYVRFSYNHMGFSTQQQRFNKVTGSVTYDPQAQSGSTDVVIDLKSVDTGSPLSEHLQGTDFFNTAQYPTATFKSTSVRFRGGEPVAIEGNLTIKGVTRPVTLTVTHFKQGTNMMKKAAIGADAVGHIKRSEFNLGKFAPMVSDEVTITVDFEAAAS
ncbi:MAG TPA: YceI family protein [Steroidobacteraceae bacterium]|jgi:polyisoprenoid-binding protein YceI|nr:YceI family protein [Steroidobacteraceae bacterium]